MSRCSRVCGITPSSAATTSTTRVDAAPRRRPWRARSARGPARRRRRRVATPSGEVEVREAELDGDAALLLLLEPIGVDAGERAHQRRLAVVDVTGGADDHARDRGAATPAPAPARGRTSVLGDRPVVPGKTSGPSITRTVQSGVAPSLRQSRVAVRISACPGLSGHLDGAAQGHARGDDVVHQEDARAFHLAWHRHQLGHPAGERVAGPAQDAHGVERLAEGGGQRRADVEASRRDAHHQVEGIGGGISWAMASPPVELGPAHLPHDAPRPAPVLAETAGNSL